MAETMRAFVIEGPGASAVHEVPVPHPGRGQVVVAVERAGVCGTDVELLAGTMPYLAEGAASFPLRPGHEWSGRVIETGPGVEPGWLGAHVTGDTMIGCGRCGRCRAGRHHVCDDRFEIGIRGGWHGALAERLLVPEVSLRRLPSSMSPAAAALVEPAGNAWRAVHAAGIGPGSRTCVWGPGTLGLLAVQLCVAMGVEVDVVGPDPAGRVLARRLGAGETFHPDDAGPGGYDAVIDTSNDPGVPARAVEQVEPSGRVVLVGLADQQARLDARRPVLRDVTVVGLLAASQGLEPAIAAFRDGWIDADALISRVVPLDEVGAVLSDLSGAVAHDGRGAPKVHVDPVLRAVESGADVSVAGSAEM